METTIRLKVDDYLLTSVKFGSSDYPLGSEVAIAFETDGILLFDSKDGRLVVTGKIA